jgi:hypothetical protein
VATISGAITNCEKCGGPVWDNRKNKKNPKGPDFKCKDATCATAYWLKDLFVDGEPEETVKAPAKKPAATPRSVFAIPEMVEKMDEAYLALTEKFGTGLVSLDTCFKLAFTELKGRNPGD